MVECTRSSFKLKTPLHNIHSSLGAKTISFFGWDMPLYYDSIIKEHKAVREEVGVFDVSHMGNFVMTGKDAYKAINHLISNDLKKISVGSGIYSPLLYENGTFVDDIIVYYESDDKFYLIVNASNVEKDFSWMAKNVEGKFDVTLSNVSNDFCLLAIQGKKSMDYIKTLLPSYRLDKPFAFQSAEFKGSNLVVANTGYTGEVGVEVLVPNEVAEDFFNEILKLKIKPCGLGSRDTLRIEKGFSLYGNEINDQFNALEAGLGWAVAFTKDFIGKQKLVDYKSDKVNPKKKMAGFMMDEKAFARNGQTICSESNEPIGVVTSGCFSPSLKKSIGLGYVPKEYKIGDEIKIKIRDKFFTAKLHKRSFI